MAISDYLISSRAWTTQTPTFNASAQGVTAAAGGLYLYHPTASLSLLARVVAAMAAASITDPAAYITEAGYVRLTAGSSFSVTWNAATTLRDLLGFTGDLGSATGHTAPNRSTLLWRAGKRLTPELAPLGAHGQRVLDLSVAHGPQGVLTVRQEGSATVVNRFSARHIPLSRFFAAAPTTAAGDFLHFWEFELAAARKWYLLRNAEEGSSTTAAADLSSAEARGPYVADMTQPEMRRGQFTREQGFERVEAYYTISVPAIQTAEFS